MTPHTATITDLLIEHRVPAEVVAQVVMLACKNAKQAVAEEREACAKVVEGSTRAAEMKIAGTPIVWTKPLAEVAAAIRARNTDAPQE